ncbi:MAG: sulfatase [Planctomycetota bacterium]
MPKPNILFLMTDQQRWDALGASGGWVRTPNLDRIAEEGVRFANAITTSPVCIPARVSLATGLYPHTTQVWNNTHYTLAPDAPTWMRAIRDAGYRTSLFGKTHLHPHGESDLRDREDLLHAYGLDDVDEIGGPRASVRVGSHMTARWERLGLWAAYREDYAERFGNTPWTVRPSTLPPEEYADVYVGQRAKEYLAGYDRDEPWCCWVSFGGPHEPWDAPEPYASMYRPEEMPPPVPRAELGGDRPRGRLDEALAAPDPRTPEEVAAMRANYAGNVTLIDDQIGEILEVLEARGELENTVIAFSSDHGELNGDHGLIYKSQFLDGCLRVPLLVRTPATARRGGAVCESPAEWIDIGPTLAELAGAELPYFQCARSLCPVLDDPAATHRTEALAELHGEVCLLTEAYKIALNADGEAYLLFDRKNDPDEQHNLAGRPEWAEVETRLRLRALSRIVAAQPQL